MVTGEKKVSTNVEKQFYVGLAKVEVAAVNPTRAQLNKLFGREDSDDDKEIEYTGTDKEDNRRSRIAFWLYSADLDKFFSYTFNITDKVRLNTDGTKAQLISQTLGTSWIPFKLDENDEPTEELDESVVADWFVDFKDKDKNVIGKKKYRPALLGEEELGIFMRAWLNEFNWFSPKADALVDTEKIFEGDFSELQSLVGHEFTGPFLVTLGVRTDEEDSEKQYQQVYGKEFLPENFLPHIEKNFKGSKSYFTERWEKFVERIEGEYGFKAYYELTPAKEYNKEDDVTASDSAKAEVPAKSRKF